MPDQNVHAIPSSGPLSDVIYLHVDHLTAVLAESKVASTSLIGVLGGQSQLRLVDLPAYRSVLCFVRDPIQRVQSCWNYFNEYDNWPEGGKPATLTTFIDEILAGRDNKHWCPQETRWPADIVLEVHLYEQIGRIMAQFGVKLPITNTSAGRKGQIQYRIDELEELYQYTIGIRHALLQP